MAIGVGLHLLPEATRRAAAGADPRPVLLRALVMLAIVAAPALVVFAAAPETLLRVAFGPDLTLAADALPPRGRDDAARRGLPRGPVHARAGRDALSLGPRGRRGVAEPFLLTAASPGVVAFAGIVFAVQGLAACSVLALGLLARRPRPAAV